MDITYLFLIWGTVYYCFTHNKHDMAISMNWKTSLRPIAVFVAALLVAGLRWSLQLWLKVFDVYNLFGEDDADDDHDYYYLLYYYSTTYVYLLVLLLLILLVLLLLFLLVFLLLLILSLYCYYHHELNRIDQHDSAGDETTQAVVSPSDRTHKGLWVARDGKIWKWFALVRKRCGWNNMLIGVITSTLAS